VEVPAEEVTTIAIPAPVVDSPAPIHKPFAKESAQPTDAAQPVPITRVAPPEPARTLPPALEPLSSFEAETDAVSPSWMDRFTLGRAISIMLLLTIVAGSFVYHRELGRALIWLGQQIEGEDSPEISHTTQPAIPAPTPTIPEAIPAVTSTKPQASVPPPNTGAPAQAASSEPKSVELPRASENTPAPQLKDATPGSLVTSSQVNRSPAGIPSAENTAEAGQPEYQQAMQILRSPSSEKRLPEAVRLLWVAVQNGNIGAEIALAELYEQGRGVTRNCDQTRILLSAAARKGSSEAQKRLQEFQREGCAE
jgi:hypothetical protein